jgi:hypothetical protein
MASMALKRPVEMSAARGLAGRHDLAWPLLDRCGEGFAQRLL